MSSRAERLVLFNPLMRQFCFGEHGRPLLALFEHFDHITPRQWDEIAEAYHRANIRFVDYVRDPSAGRLDMALRSTMFLVMHTSSKEQYFYIGMGAAFEVAEASADPAKDTIAHLRHLHFLGFNSLAELLAKYGEQAVTG